MIPDYLVEVVLEAGLRLPNVIKEAGLAPSTSDAIRLIGQGAVKINNERVNDANQVLQKGESIVLQVGKRRFARIVIKE